MKTIPQLLPTPMTILVVPALAGILAWSGCCAPSHVVSSAGDTAAGAVKGAGKTAASVTRSATKTAASAVGTAGKVVHSGVHAAGTVAKAAVGVTADVVTAPFVIFKDTKSGKTCRVPWREGMTLATAPKDSKADAEISVVRILRNTNEIQPDRIFRLKPGDVIEVKGKDNVPALFADAGA